MTFERSMVGEVHVLTPTKNLVGDDDVNSLMVIIDEVTAAGPAKVVVDLGKIAWVTSVGVGGLWKAHEACGKSQGWLRLARAGARNKHVFEHLRMVFETFETVEDAVKADGKKTKKS